MVVHARLIELEGVIPPVLIQKHNQGQTVTCRVGEQIEIQLEENPTTGYRWKLHDGYDPVLSLVNSQFRVAGSGAIGSGGTRAFNLLANATGTAAIRFSLRQEWEGEKSATEHFSVNVRVS